MRRRAFITLLGGAAVAWPLAARAQGEQVRRIGVLTVFSREDVEGQRRVAALLQGLRELGWVDGRNVRIDFRWAAGDRDRAQFYAGELVGIKPDVIFVNNALVLPLLTQETHTIPIVFVQVAEINLIGELIQDWRHLDQRIASVSTEIEALAKQDESCQRLMSIPGIGPIISSAVVAAIGNGTGFKQGRDFAAWLGLIPKQESTGDRTIVPGTAARGGVSVRRE
jgi:ABC-type uncharacterized transport system substrate-binding protein